MSGYHGRYSLPFSASEKRYEVDVELYRREAGAKGKEAPADIPDGEDEENIEEPPEDIEDEEQLEKVYSAAQELRLEV
jgi:hypothetical protein